MAKLQDYEIRRLGQSLVDFKDDIRDLVNFGKMQFPITNSVPGWKTNDGEMAFYTATAVTDRRIYVGLDSGWSLFSQVFGTGNPSPPGGVEGSVQYNSGGIFGGNALFLHDANSGSVYVMKSRSTAFTSLILVNSVNFQSGLQGTGGAVDIAFGFANETISILSN